MAATKAEAAEALPDGTVLTVPAGPSRVLVEGGVLLSTAEAKATLLSLRDLESCRAWLEDCEKKVVAETPPGGGYFTTPQGHAVMIGGFAVSISAAFVLGAVLVK